MEEHSKEQQRTDWKLRTMLWEVGLSNDMPSTLGSQSRPGVRAEQRYAGEAVLIFGYEPHLVVVGERMIKLITQRTSTAAKKRKKNNKRKSTHHVVVVLERANEGQLVALELVALGHDGIHTQHHALDRCLARVHSPPLRAHIEACARQSLLGKG